MSDIQYAEGTTEIASEVWGPYQVVKFGQQDLDIAEAFTGSTGTHGVMNTVLQAFELNPNLSGDSPAGSMTEDEACTFAKSLFDTYPDGTNHGEDPANQPQRSAVNASYAGAGDPTDILALLGAALGGDDDEDDDGLGIPL